MSESLGKPWIESSAVEILANYAHELPSLAKLQTHAQIVKFLTFREDTGDGSQPKDRNTVLWAEITDGEWIIPVRIANEATNKIEDEYKRALTYYRRGFFTLKAAISFGFVSEQIKSQIKISSSKQLFIDIVELSYISGGGQAVPVTTRAVALQTPRRCQTGTNLQAQERATRDAGRASIANSRRLNAINANKRASNPTKTPTQSVTPQSLTDNLDAKRNWQEGWFGKRRELRGVDYIHPPEGFEPADDQQAKFKGILERIRMATPTYPYDRILKSRVATSIGDDSSVPDQLSIPSTVRRSSQAISSTPMGLRLPQNKPTGSQLRTLAATDAVNSSSDSESDVEGSNSDRGLVRSRQVSRPPTNTYKDRLSRFHIPIPRPSDLRADESHEEVSPGAEGRRGLLGADDTITEQLLSQALASVGQRKRVPTALVPDSDPPNSIQRPQVRHSSPWDCEDGSSSEHEDISCSPEATRHNPIKGQRRFSPALSLAQPMLASQDNHMGSQSVIQATNGAKQGSSGQGESQPSAAASLPSPPPEDSNGYKLDFQPPDSVPSFRANATISLTRDLSGPLSPAVRHDPKKELIQQRGESSEIRPRVEKVTSRKRRLSQSPSHAQPLQELALSRNGEPVANSKERHADSRASTLAHKNAPRQFNVGREGQTNESRVSSNATKAAHSNGYTDVIPRDHEAWTNPTWMNNVRMPKQVKSSAAKIPRTSDARPLDKLHTKRIHRPTVLRILQPPFHYPTPAVECVPSPEFPSATASQFADADEDFGIASSKVEHPTPARPTNKPVAWRSRISNVTQPVPVAGGQTAVFTPGHSKQPRTSSKAAGNNVRVTQDREQAVRRGKHNLEGQQRPKNAPTARREISTEDSATHRPYLGGFQPSMAVDLPRKHQLTWENWLEVTKDAYSFWLEQLS